MAVLGLYGVVLEVPELGPGIRFYTDAGLQVQVDGNTARFNCAGQERDCIVLLGGAPRKRIHHLVLRADPHRLDQVHGAAAAHGGAAITAPQGFADSGLWLTDPHGLRIHLVDAPPEPPLQPCTLFETNAPGRLVRKDRGAVPSKSSIGPILPLRLGHVLLFTPDVMRSVEFFTHVLGMGLADRSQDVVAFMCARRESDHHVVAFAKSSDIGFHHASFQVASLDEVGIAGRRLIEKGNGNHWGFGRHTIGSNFFHYVQDPWGSWFEYYSDMDYISDHSNWQATDYAPEDSFLSWGPEPPADFVHNYEAPQSLAQAR